MVPYKAFYMMTNNALFNAKRYNFHYALSCKESADRIKKNKILLILKYLKDELVAKAKDVIS